MTRGGAAANAPAPAIPRLGIAAHIWGTECASGLGSDDNNIAGTTFPQALGLAAAWDKSLAFRVANATAVELRARHNADLAAGVVQYHHGINCWSPVINIMRHWAWGRNDETFGECPVLTSAITHAFVSGLQGSHPRYVAATAGCKHMGVHGGPDATRRTFDANVTLRDWSTTFLAPFETCVQAGGLGIMCSFNAIRGVRVSRARGIHGGFMEAGHVKESTRPERNLTRTTADVCLGEKMRSGDGSERTVWRGEGGGDGRGETTGRS